MRSLLSKITALAVVLFMMLGFMALPSASAQTYPPNVPPNADCASQPPPSIAIVGTDIVVSFPTDTLTCVIRVVVSVNPIVYDGPPPFASTLTIPLPALVGDNHTATVTAYYAIGGTKSDSVSISAASLAAARAKFEAAGGAAGAVPAVPAVPAANLAFTGSDVNLPLAAGALLVGSGGLVLLAARKRERTA